MNRQDKILVFSAAALFLLALAGGAGLLLSSDNRGPDLPPAGDPLEDVADGSSETTFAYAEPGDASDGEADDPAASEPKQSDDSDSAASSTQPDQPEDVSDDEEGEPSQTPPVPSPDDQDEPEDTESDTSVSSDPVFAFVTDISFGPGGARVTIDRAEFLLDAEAQAAAAQAGATLPDAGYFIVNERESAETYIMESTVRVRLTTAEDNTIGTPRHVTSTDWAAMYVAGDPAQIRIAPYWFRINGGKILSVQEQFLP